MKTDNANSGSTSAATSAGAKPTTSNSSSNNPSAADETKSVGKTGVGEAAYLTRQQQLATQAISQTLSDMTKGLTRAADPHLLMHNHPWMTLGASAVAGFAAAAALIPSKEQQALKKLAAIERALNPKTKKTEVENGHAAEDGESKSKGAGGYKSGRSGLMHAVMGEVIGAIKPAIISLLSAGVSASAARPSEDEMKAAAAAEDVETGNAAGQQS